MLCYAYTHLLLYLFGSYGWLMDVAYTTTALHIDGLDQEKQWQQASWLQLNQVIIGGKLEP